jgi:hypothetical protein
MTDDLLHYRDNLSVLLRHVKGEQVGVARSANVLPARTTVRGSVHIELTDSLTRYAFWQSPTVIISDGPYGVGGFHMSRRGRGILCQKRPCGSGVQSSVGLLFTQYSHCTDGNIGLSMYGIRASHTSRAT